MHNKQAAIYKTMGWDKHQLENLERLKQFVDLSNIKTHHDIACGTGDFVDAISKLGIVSTGSDLAPAMIAQARELYKAYQFHQADMRTVTLKTPVDLITINYFSLNMVPTAADIKLSIKNFAANLNPGGILAFDFSTPGFVHYADIHEMYEENNIVISQNITSQNGVCRFDLYWLTTTDGVNYVRESEVYTEVTLEISDLRATLESAGFDVLKLTPMSADEANVTDLNQLTAGLYIVARKLSQN